MITACLGETSVDECIKIVDEHSKASVESQTVEDMIFLVKETERSKEREICQDRKRKREPDEYQDVVVERVTIPVEKMGHVAGKGFGNKDRLQETYKIRVEIPERGGEVVTLIGPAKQVADAKADILENLPDEVVYTVNRRYISSVKGYQDRTVKDLCYRFRVKIKFEDNDLIISGRKRDCDRALSSIKLIESKEKEKDVAYLNALVNDPWY